MDKKQILESELYGANCDIKEAERMLDIYKCRLDNYSKIVELYENNYDKFIFEESTPTKNYIKSEFQRKINTSKEDTKEALNDIYNSELKLKFLSYRKKIVEHALKNLT
jgi:hypothetical protein